MLPDSCNTPAMGLDSNTSLSWPPLSQRRGSHTPAKLRLKDERKRIIRALDAKYRTIDDHERGMLRFVLIRNNLRRLQREAREEKLARHRTNLNGSRVSNLSPSCLSATRSRSPSPPNDYSYADPISPPYTAVGSSSLAEDDDPPAKRPCLFFDDDKENEMDVDEHCHHHSQQQQQQQQQQQTMNFDSKASSSPYRPIDDAQEILRDLYETCVNEGITSRSTSSYSDTFFCPQPQQQQTTFSLSMSASCGGSSSINSSNSSSTTNSCSNSSCDSDWSRHSHYPFNCGHSSLLGNDLQSVVFHSLITSLES